VVAVLAKPTLGLPQVEVEVEVEVEVVARLLGGLELLALRLV